MSRGRRRLLTVFLVVQALVLAEASLGLGMRTGKFMVREMSDAFRPKVDSLVELAGDQGPLDEQGRFRAVQDLTFTGVEIANRRTDPVHRSLLIGVGISIVMLVVLAWPARSPNASPASPS